MSLLTGIFSDLIADERVSLAKEREHRSSLENPQTPLAFPAEWLLDIFNGGRTNAGVRVSELTAFSVTTFLSCVDLIAGAVASRPAHVYERTQLENKRIFNRIAIDHDVYDLVNFQPNVEMSWSTFMWAFMAHRLVWPGAYAEIQRDGGNRPVAFWPRNPGKTKPYRVMEKVTLEPVPWRPFPVTLAAGEMCYHTTDWVAQDDNSENEAERAGSGRLIAAADMLHAPGWSLDGRIGQGVVWMARNTLGLAIATEKFGSKYFANFAQPSGFLEMPVGVPKETREESKKSWQQAHGGENAHTVAVLPAGIKFTQTSSDPEKAQNIQTQQFLRNQICSVFHVPPHMVGDVDKGRANTEQLAQEFLQYTLSPHLAALRHEFKRKIFPNPGIGRAARNRFFIDFDLHDLLRPDAASREKFYASGRQWGYLRANDVLEMEGRNPIEDPSGEELWMPINMTLTDTPVDPTNQDGAGNGKSDKNNSSDTQDQRYAMPFNRVFRDALGRVMTRKSPDSTVFTRAFGPILWSLADVFCMEKKCKRSQEVDLFVAGHLVEMRKRHSEWKDDDATSESELRMAVKAIREAVEKEKVDEIDTRIPQLQS